MGKAWEPNCYLRNRFRERYKMANYRHTRIAQDSIHVRGILSDDGTEITYLNKDKEEMVVDVMSCLKNYVGEEITFSVSTKEEVEVDD
jgi:hypothetical protein